MGIDVKKTLRGFYYRMIKGVKTAWCKLRETDRSDVGQEDPAETEM